MNAEGMELGAGNLRKCSTERGLAPGGVVFDDVDAAERTIARGEFVLVVDDERRENEGELLFAADADNLSISHSWCVISAVSSAWRCRRTSLIAWL